MAEPGGEEKKDQEAKRVVHTYPLVRVSNLYISQFFCLIFKTQLQVQCLHSSSPELYLSRIPRFILYCYCFILLYY